MSLRECKNSHYAISYTCLNNHFILGMPLRDTCVGGIRLFPDGSNVCRQFKDYGIIDLEQGI